MTDNKAPRPLFDEGCGGVITETLREVNARIAPLIAALDRWSAKYKAELSIHALSPEFTAVQSAYRKLRGES